MFSGGRQFKRGVKRELALNIEYADTINNSAVRQTRISIYD